MQFCESIDTTALRMSYFLIELYIQLENKEKMGGMNKCRNVLITQEKN